MRRRVEDADCLAVAEILSVPQGEVKRAVASFFGIIVSGAKSLPFNNVRKIYTRNAFNEYAFAVNIPSIGRVGPVYSRYLRWRANEAKQIEQEPRSNYRHGVTQSEIENMAGEILAGMTPAPLVRKRGNELYHRVWLVGEDGKRLARQVILKKEEKDV